MDRSVSGKQPRQWSGQSRGGGFGYRFFIYAIRFLGIRCAYCFLAMIVFYFIPFAPKATRAIWKYNRERRKLGFFSSAKEIYCHYYVFGQTLIDKIAMKCGMAGRYRYMFDNYDGFVEVLGRGSGVIMIGAHIGCWEAGAGFFGKCGKKLNIVMFDAEHRSIKNVIDRNRRMDDDYSIIAVNHDPIEAMLQMKIVLDKGECVCFNGDRYVDGERSVMRDFLGAEACFPSGPFRIAAKCNVPVVFYYAMREPDMTWRFIFEEAAGGNGAMTAESLMTQYIESLEEKVAAYPRQWFNFYDFWNIND